MGISGLLPALQAITKKKHLSELRGKRVAVDAYGWLHKGVYGCATELALGKPTTKYVHFAMKRVELLRHHGIEPYLVFDGGPLPAKEGTEGDRKKKREEQITRGRAFANQGKHSQARECFVKSIDVTPEMAYQLIKALQADSVQYVVAPYEADAQLAYLERQGLVDAILTEDSDLLVFGCQNVWFKLSTDAVVETISRSDFNSVTTTAANSASISLVGWNDSQFRAMAILSGCDYLPSIPGVGLKTAATLLKKWKTAEMVIRHLNMEGKKSVPIGYLKKFQLAEKCFLHQRVYCPIQEQLVHLTPIDEDEWNAEFDTYVGRHIDATLAKMIAAGEVDPVSLKAMKDINPNYRPLRRPNRQPLATRTHAVAIASNKGEERAKGGLFNFFGANPIIPPASKSEPATTKKGSAGKASGKRTLAEISDQEAAQKQRKKHRNSSSPRPVAHQSKFFSASTSRAISGIHRRHSDGVVGLRNGSGSAAGPSTIIYVDTDKENDFHSEDDIPSEPDDDASYLSIQAEVRHTSMELDIEEFPDGVEQEDGYISHAFDSGDMQDLSSPTRTRESRRESKLSSSSRKGKGRQNPLDEDDSYFDDIEAVSSPMSTKRRKAPFGKCDDLSLDDYIETPVRRRNQGEGSSNNPVVLIDPTPTPTKSKAAIIELDSPSVQCGPDLRSMLGDVDDTELDFIRDDNGDVKGGLNSSLTRIPNQDPLEPYLPPAPSPDTPDDYDTTHPDKPGQHFVPTEDELLDDIREEEERTHAETERSRIILQSMREKHSYKPLATRTAPSVSAQKMKGTVTNDGRNTVLPRLKAVPRVGSPKKEKAHASGSGERRCQNFTRNEVNVTPMGRHTILGPAPRSLPNLKKKNVQPSLLALSGRQLGVLLVKNPRPSSSVTKVPPVVDLTMDDSGDEALVNTPSGVIPRLDLERFRCTS